MLPPHCGQIKLIIEEMMLELNSPGIVSIVLIAVSVLIMEVLAISVGASNMPTLDANNGGKLIAGTRPRQRCSFAALANIRQMTDECSPGSRQVSRRPPPIGCKYIETQSLGRTVRACDFGRTNAISGSSAGTFA